MSKSKKTDNILLRVNSDIHNLIKFKSKLFGRKKSDYIRYAVLSHWEDSETNNSSFKELLVSYREGDNETKAQIVNLLFEYYRRKGYPHNILNDQQKIKSMDSIIKSNKILLENNHLQQNVVGLALANFFHPHMIEVQYHDNKRTPKETFDNDDSLKDCINRWLELEKVPNPAGMRRILKTRNNTRSVVNFKPIISKFIYNTYVPENGKVLDPCSGYSGRLIGCIAANKNILYHGIDPDNKTALGNMECASFFNSQYNDDIYNNKMYKFRFRFDLGCAEDIMTEIKDNNYDIVMTSPPYFSQEKYSNDFSQSYLKFSNYQDWLNKFLFVIINESYRILKEDGKLILNIKNLINYPIANDLCNYCKKNWELEKTYHMRLSNSEYHRKEGEKTFHTEPIFVFKKVFN